MMTVLKYVINGIPNPCNCQQKIDSISHKPPPQIYILIVPMNIKHFLVTWLNYMILKLNI